MKIGLEAKFQTNDQCKQALVNTGMQKLGEASLTDKFWGTGVGLADKLALNSGAWTGLNHMGKILEEVREIITF